MAMGKPEFFTSTLFDSSIRMAFWDVNPSGKETVLLTHGEPTWSYLNRRLVTPLVQAGYRVVMFDQIGCGWSDKPVREADYSYFRHVAWNEDLLFNHLNLTNITALFQDWGGLLGLRVAARNPDRFARLVLTNTGLPTADTDFEGPDYISEGFYQWKDFAARGVLKTPGTIGKLLRRGASGPSCGGSGELSEAEVAAYQAPYPDKEYCAGVHIFPELVPTPNSDLTGRPQPVGGEANRAAWAVFEQWRKPILLAFAPGDHILGHAYSLWQTKCPACHGKDNVDILGVGHFVQDGGGEQLVQAMLEFMLHNPLPRSARL